MSDTLILKVWLLHFISISIKVTVISYLLVQVFFSNVVSFYCMWMGESNFILGIVKAWGYWVQSKQPWLSKGNVDPGTSCLCGMRVAVMVWGGGAVVSRWTLLTWLALPIYFEGWFYKVMWTIYFARSSFLSSTSSQSSCVKFRGCTWMIPHKWTCKDCMLWLSFRREFIKKTYHLTCA